jgi:PAS domain S-box-containing protein
LVLLWAFPSAQKSEAQVEPVKRILILNELDGPSHPAVALMNQGIRDAFAGSPYNIEFYTESMDTVYFPDPGTQKKTRDFYLQKYNNRRPDVIITVGPTPLGFLSETRDSVLAGIPVIFLLPFGDATGSPALGPNFTGVENDTSPAETLRIALRMQPNTRSLVIVGGSGVLDKKLMASIRGSLASYENQLNISFLTDLPFPEMLERLKRLPPHTVVFYAAITRDAAGRQFLGSMESEPQVVASSNAPVFSLFDIFVGHSEVGGYVSSLREQGIAAGNMALRIFGGERPREIPRINGVFRYLFDAQALDRWGIREDLLPPGSVVLNRQPNLWESYRRYVVGAGLLIAAQMLLIAGLLWQRAKKRNAENKYRRIFEQSAEGILRVAPNGKILAANPAIARILGYETPAELMASVPDTQHIWRHPEQRTELMGELTEKGLIQRHEFELLRRDGVAIWVSATVGNIRKPDGSPAYFEGFFEDVTARKQMHQQLLQAQKLEAVGRLAGGVSHDFNNILGVIVGYSDLTLKDNALSESTRRRLTEIRGAARRGADITRQLLAFSRKQVLQTKVLEVNALVADSAAMLGQLLGEDIELVISLALSGGSVLIDPSGLHQIMMNLAVNARDAMASSGRLTIETANVALEEACAGKDSSLRPGEYVMLSVSDTGAGIDSETQRHVFEPFFTTKEIGRGTGLGLSIVYGVVQQSGGHISVQSEVGVGTTFKIYFPRVPSSTAASPPRAEEAPPHGSETILLVEDDSALRSLNANLLHELGYHVIQSRNGKEALEAAALLPGTLHLLLTDVVMPGVNGKQLAEQMTTTRPDLKVLFISGYADSTGRELPPDVPFLQKPFASPVLAQKVRDVLDANNETPAYDTA